MRDRKRNNLLSELRTCFGENKYEKIVTEKVDWLITLDVKIIPVSARAAIEIEQISYGGKVCWEKGANPKKPKSLMLNMLDFTGTKFVVIFLHECGHITDKDNDLISFETIESEISAWNHALLDFNCLKPGESEKAIFAELMEKSLLSYRVDKAVIKEMISNIS